MHPHCPAALLCGGHVEDDGWLGAWDSMVYHDARIFWYQETNHWHIQISRELKSHPENNKINPITQRPRHRISKPTPEPLNKLFRPETLTLNASTIGDHPVLTPPQHLHPRTPVNHSLEIGCHRRKRLDGGEIPSHRSRCRDRDLPPLAQTQIRNHTSWVSRPELGCLVYLPVCTTGRGKIPRATEQR